MQEIKKINTIMSDTHIANEKDLQDFIDTFPEVKGDLIHLGDLMSFSKDSDWLQRVQGYVMTLDKALADHGITMWLLGGNHDGEPDGTKTGGIYQMDKYTNIHDIREMPVGENIHPIYWQVCAPFKEREGRTDKQDFKDRFYKMYQELDTVDPDKKIVMFSHPQFNLNLGGEKFEDEYCTSEKHIENGTFKKHNYNETLIELQNEIDFSKIDQFYCGHIHSAAGVTVGRSTCLSAPSDGSCNVLGYVDNDFNLIDIIKIPR